MAIIKNIVPAAEQQVAPTQMKTREMLENETGKINAEEYADIINQIGDELFLGNSSYFTRYADEDEGIEAITPDDLYVKFKGDFGVHCTLRDSCRGDVQEAIQYWNSLDPEEREEYETFGEYFSWFSNASDGDFVVCDEYGNELRFNY